MSHRHGTPTHRNLSHLRRLLAVLVTLGLAGASFVSVSGAQELPPPEGRIVNGELAGPGELPHQVLVLLDGRPHCGGAIVGPSTVVSAAHCFENGRNFSIRAGVTNLNDGAAQDRRVARVISHPNYRRVEAPDVAVLQLEAPLVFNQLVGSIALAAADEVVIGDQAKVSGWGALSEAAQQYPDDLLRATLTLIGDAECEAGLRAVEPRASIIEPLELCASAVPSDSCYGDSGGPLTVGFGADSRLAGLVSWGLACGGPAPGIYAEVSAVADWIADNANEALTGTSFARVAGDVDGNEQVDADDVLAILSANVGRPQDRYDAWAADMNGDANVSLLDALLLARQVPG